MKKIQAIPEANNSSTATTLANNSLSLASTNTITESGSLKGALWTYSYNPTGICGSTASAILLKYYDLWVNGNYIPSNLESSSGETLIKYLVPYIEGSERGSYAIDVESGLETYMYIQGISNAAISQTYNYNTVKSKINANRPVLILINNHPGLGDHWIVAHGYKKGYYDSSLLNFTTIIVNDGHGNNNISVDPCYMRDIVYLNT